MSERVIFFFFFFQAEDGIRDKLVTGVQTCALPILPSGSACSLSSSSVGERPASKWPAPSPRSEERRVGKSVDLGGRRIIKKKKNTKFGRMPRTTFSADKRRGER